MNLFSDLTLVRLTLLAFRNVRRHRRRSALTILIIWFCFVALNLFQGYIASTRRSWGQMLIRNEFGHFQIFHKEYSKDNESSFDHMISGDAVERVLAQLRSDPRVQFAGPRLQLSGLLGNNRESCVFVGSARTPAELEEMYLSSPVKLGEFVTDEVPNGIVLGTKLADKLDVEIDDSVLLMSASDTGSIEAMNGEIIGLSRTGNDQWDSMSVYVRLADALEFLHIDAVHSIVVLLKEGVAVQPTMQDALDRIHSEKLPLTARSFSENAKFFVQILAMYSRYFNISLAVLSLVVFISVANSMYMSITDRMREFATMKTLGIARHMVFSVLILEGLILSLFAVILGCATSFGLHHVINEMGITLPPPPGGDERLPFTVFFKWESLGLLASNFFLLAILSSVPPALHVVRAGILKGLRSV